MGHLGHVPPDTLGHARSVPDTPSLPFTWGMLGASRSRWASFFLTRKRTEVQLLPRSPHRLTRVFTAPRSLGRRRQSPPVTSRPGDRFGDTITTNLIGLRQADTSQVPSGRARYGLPRPTLSRVRRTVRSCCALGPLYGSATGREGAAPRRRAEGAHGPTLMARIAVRTHSFKSNPIEQPTPRWQVVGQPVAGACRAERTSTAPPKR